MSYDGYEIWLCARGHRRSFGCYDTPAHRGWACECGAACAWRASVDQTNGPGEAPVLVVAEPAEFATCPCCKHRTQTREVTYCVPKAAP